MLEDNFKTASLVYEFIHKKLLAIKSSNVFRLFSSDIGLLTSAYPAETKVELINKNGKVNNGAHLKKAYVLSIGNVETEGAITYLPIYMCYLLREQKLEQMIIELDTTGL